ncbi:sensor histidine kinase [Bacillus cereus]|nr:sensor histidine kinase [Bacillus cereus]
MTSVPHLSGGILLFIQIRITSLLRTAYQINKDQLLKLKIANNELRKSTIQTIRYASLTERTRIAREIHDGLGHQITSLIVQLQALQCMLPNDSLAAQKTIMKLLDTARIGMEEIRMAVHEWEEDKEILGITALKGLISQVTENTKIQFHVKEEGPFSIWPEDTNLTIFRILQELLTNVIRHSNANKVYIHIQEEADHLFLMVSDNGRFINNETFQNGFGIKGMIERCKLIGGEYTFSVNRFGGLKAEFTIPLANFESFN